MEEILHHLAYIKPCKYWDIDHINWCRISSINSIIHASTMLRNFMKIYYLTQQRQQHLEHFVLMMFHFHQIWTTIFNQYPYHPCMVYIYLHELLISMVNIGRYFESSFSSLNGIKAHESHDFHLNLKYLDFHLEKKLIFFRWVETTNQKNLRRFWSSCHVEMLSPSPKESRLVYRWNIGNWRFVARVLAGKERRGRLDGHVVFPE